MSRRPFSYRFTVPHDFSYPNNNPFSSTMPVSNPTPGEANALVQSLKGLLPGPTFDYLNMGNRIMMAASNMPSPGQQAMSYMDDLFGPDPNQGGGLGYGGMLG